MAPPKIRASPVEEGVSRRSIRQSIPASRSTATMDTPTSRGVREREEFSAKMPKATPGFCERTILKNPGITVFESYDPNWVSTSHLVHRSSENTPRATRKATIRRTLSGIVLNVPHRGGAGRADGGELGRGADVFGVLIAALAFGPARAVNSNFDAFPCA